MSLTKLSLGGNYDVIYRLFLPRESLVSDIPAGDGNIEKLFLRCIAKPYQIYVKQRSCTNVKVLNKIRCSLYLSLAWGPYSLIENCAMLLGFTFEPPESVVKKEHDTFRRPIPCFVHREETKALFLEREPQWNCTLMTSISGTVLDDQNRR